MRMESRKWSPNYFTNSLRNASFKDALGNIFESRQKRLDKIDDLLYNIRTGSKDRNMNYIEVGLFDINPNPEAKSSITASWNHVRAFATIVGETNDKIGTKAFIAGGAIRDSLLGYTPRDIDIFIPLTADDDKDDEAVYFSEIFRQKAKIFGADFEAAIKEEGSLSYDKDELAAYTLVSHHARFGAPPPQVIAREGSLEDIVNSFDYDLVKAYYHEGKIMVAETLPDIVKKGRITVDTLKAKHRLSVWRRRTGHKISVRCLEKSVKMDPWASTATGLKLVNLNSFAQQIAVDQAFIQRNQWRVDMPGRMEI